MRQIEKFYAIGITVRTTNENGQMARDIPTLWGRLFAEGILDKIPNKLGSEIYCIYTDYEKDYTKPYSVVLGCRVAHLNDIPAGMVGQTVGGGAFTPFTAKGDLTKGVIYATWQKIWNTPLLRRYTADFEVYGAKSANWHDAEVDIFVATYP